MQPLATSINRQVIVAPSAATKASAIVGFKNTKTQGLELHPREIAKTATERSRRSLERRLRIRGIKRFKPIADFD